MSQVERVVAHADVSFNTELEVIGKLSDAAYGSGRTHGIVLMVELGDLREGIMPEDLLSTVRETLRCRNIVLKGIGTNLACRSAVSPDAGNMAKLSALADSIDAAFGLTLDIVSGGNSGNLQWAFSAAGTGRINDLRLGESILLGVEPLHRQPIHGLYTDAITLVAGVIESKVKPSQPWGNIGQTAFDAKPAVKDRGFVSQAILAIGHQDTDPEGLTAPSGIEIVGASSDHLILNLGNNKATVGAEITFQPNYSAVLRAMTSPFVTKILKARMHNAEAIQRKQKQAISLRRLSTTGPVLMPLAYPAPLRAAPEAPRLVPRSGASGSRHLALAADSCPSDATPEPT